MLEELINCLEAAEPLPWDDAYSFPQHAPLCRTQGYMTRTEFPEALGSRNSLAFNTESICGLDFDCSCLPEWTIPCTLVYMMNKVVKRKRCL